jgi:ABC-2 type transport system permease protein
MRLRPVIVQCKTQFLTMVRIPSFVVPIFVFPPLFYIYFGESAATSPQAANQLMVSYMLYATLAVVFFEMCAAIAEDRRQTWEPYLWTLPNFHRTRLLGRLITGYLSAIISSCVIALLAYALSPVDASAVSWMLLIVMLIVGSVPFVFLAIAIGYLVHPKAVSPVSSLLFFSLAYAGSLWTAPDALPGWLAAISNYLPTRQWAEVSWSAVLTHHWIDFHWLGLLFYTIAFGLLAFIGVVRNNVLERY